MTRYVPTHTRARMVREDAESDAKLLDSTPFTPAGVGPVLGAMLAMIAALARCIEELDARLDAISCR